MIRRVTLLICGALAMAGAGSPLARGGEQDGAPGVYPDILSGRHRRPRVAPTNAGGCGGVTGGTPVQLPAQELAKSITPNSALNKRWPGALDLKLERTNPQIERWSITRELATFEPA